MGGGDLQSVSPATELLQGRRRLAGLRRRRRRRRRGGGEEDSDAAASGGDGEWDRRKVGFEMDPSLFWFDSSFYEEIRSYTSFSFSESYVVVKMRTSQLIPFDLGPSSLDCFWFKLFS